MPNPPRLSGVRTRGFTKKRPPSVSTGDNSRMTASRPNASADSSQNLKRARFDFGNPGVDAPHDEILNPPCRLCEELCEKTIFAQQKDLRSVRAENVTLRKSLQAIKNQAQLLHSAFVAGKQGMAALNECQGELQRLGASLKSFLDQSQFHDARSDVPQTLGADNSTWTQVRAPAVGAEATTDVDAFDGDLFDLHHGNLFDLQEIPPINLNDEDSGGYQA